MKKALVAMLISSFFLHVQYSPEGHSIVPKLLSRARIKPVAGYTVMRCLAGRDKACLPAGRDKG